MNPHAPDHPTRHTSLRDLVADRLGARWPDFAREHPNLAAALDRTSLVERTVAYLRDDPAYTEALREAALDEATLARAAALLERIERAVLLQLPR